MFFSLFVTVHLTFDKHLFPACSDIHWKDALLDILLKKRQKTMDMSPVWEIDTWKGALDYNSGQFALNSFFLVPKHEMWLEI